ncbi:MAG: TIGR02449 family protein [Candidatus Competibacteraceae bacterium]|nr:TIGR02449 family protein [Candidatus Competibacteraceae bacterium]
MEHETTDHNTQHILDALEARLEQLAHLCERLAEENRTLREQQSHWQAEREELLEKHELSRSRIETMVARLKALEP